MVKSKRGSRTLAIAVIAAMIMSLFAAFPGFARAQETKSAGNLENGKSYEVPISGLELDSADSIPLPAVVDAIKTGWLEGNAIVDVDKDGNREITIDFKTIEINVMGNIYYANIKDVNVYQNNDSSTGVKTKVDGTRRDAQCSSMTDEPTTVSAIDVAKFALQKNAAGTYDDFIRVNVDIDFMNKAYDGNIVLDYANAKEIKSHEPGTDPGESTNPGEGEETNPGGDDTTQTPSVDKSGLQSAYDAAAAMTQGNYTADSWADFVTARDAAKAILDNKDATADQVTKAIKDLQTAKDALAYDNILNLADGTYKVPVKLWHETKDQASMAASSVLPEAMITVSGKDIKMNIYTQPMTMGTITASLQTLKVENGTGGYTDADIVGRSSSGDPNEFSFALPHAKEYINVLVNPKVAIMGNTDIGARLKVDYSSIAKVENAESDINANATTTTATPNSPKTGDEAPMALLATLMLLSGGIGVYAYRKR